MKRNSDARFISLSHIGPGPIEMVSIDVVDACDRVGVVVEVEPGITQLSFNKIVGKPMEKISNEFSFSQFKNSMRHRT